jgi:hypothetical protein
VKVHERQAAGLGPAFGTAAAGTTSIMPPTRSTPEQIADDRKKQQDKFDRDKSTKLEHFGNERERADAGRQKLETLFLNGGKRPDGAAFGGSWFGNTRVGKFVGYGQRSLAPAALTAMEEQNFTVDSLAQNPSLTNTMQLVGHRLGRWATDENANVIRPNALRASNMLASAAQTSMIVNRTAAPAARFIMNHSAGNMGARELGYDIGATSPGGIMTLGPLQYFTPGGNRSMAMRWTDTLAAAKDFSWSKDEQKELGGIMRGMGLDYGKSFGGIFDEGKSPFAEKVSARMRDIHKSTGIDMDVIGEMVNRRRRYRPGEFESIEDDIDAFRSAAGAAGLSLNEFTKRALAAADGLASTTGMLGGDAERAMVSGAAGGLLPEQVAKLSTRARAMRAAGVEGGSYYEAYSDPAKLMRQSRREIGSVMGMDTATMRKIAAERYTKGKAGKERFNAMMTRATELYAVNPDLFGGMTPEQFMSFSDKDMKRSDLMGDLQTSLDAFHANGDKMSGFSLDRHELRTRLEGAGISEKKIESIFAKKGHAKEYEAAMRALGKKGMQDTNKVMIELAGDAKDKFNINGKKKVEVAARNTAKWVGSAMMPSLSSPIATSVDAWHELT